MAQRGWTSCAGGSQVGLAWRFRALLFCPKVEGTALNSWYVLRLVT